MIKVYETDVTDVTGVTGDAPFAGPEMLTHNWPGLWPAIVARAVAFRVADQDRVSQPYVPVCARLVRDVYPAAVATRIARDGAVHKAYGFTVDKEYTPLPLPSGWFA